MILHFAFTRRAALVLFALAVCGAQDKSKVNPPPTAKQWADLATLPDWSGIWTPSLKAQGAEIRTHPTPWNAKAAKEIAQMAADEKAGHPHGLFVNCLPESMPSWMLISHDSMEILFTPGRVTMLGESDGNRLRRIYTDGRAHSADPDLTFHGESVGHWEGQTLVVDTIGVLPQTYIAIAEGVGVPNNGDMHIVERIHLTSPDTLQDDLEITAPRVLTEPWKTSRIFFRQRARKYEIVEGVCLQGGLTADVDKNGNAVFVPAPAIEGVNQEGVK
jgi:hypothetical protein